MKLICKIIDNDICEKNLELINPKIRLAARGIIVRENEKVAVFNKVNRNEYKFSERQCKMFK